MSRSKKKARHITVDDVEYLWRATGNDGYIALTIWPNVSAGPPIHATFPYRETWLPRGGGVYSSAGDQIVITNRLVRRVILLAIGEFAYDPARKGKSIQIPQVELRIKMEDAVRGSRQHTSNDMSHPSTANTSLGG